jgi:hypothetical protein
MDPLLDDPARLSRRLIERLHALGREQCLFDHVEADSSCASAVLLLLSPCRRGARQTCLVLNQRSQQVPQPGDLCCPGGSVAPRIDGLLARLLRLPPLPLGRWPHWRHWRRERPREAERLARCLAAALREGFEEMGLNPLGVRFLGPLPPQRLVLFRRLIFPMAAWSPAPRRYRTNWEVERVVAIPLGRLLDPRRYVRCEVRLEAPGAPDAPARILPGFRLDGGEDEGILWGATFRIVAGFLQAAFGFTPPAVDGLPAVRIRLDAAYLNGRGARPLTTAAKQG